MEKVSGSLTKLERSRGGKRLKLFKMGLKISHGRWDKARPRTHEQ